jgi:hypothetical protein
MSRLQILITGQVIPSTGDVRLLVEVELLLKDAGGNWSSEIFRVDSATDLTTFPAHEAKQLGLPMPQRPSSLVRHRQTGLEVRSGFLRFRIAGMDATEYAVPTFFLGDPDTPPAPSPPATFPRKLLQPLALVDRLRFTADKDPADGTPHGTLTIEKK